ncbi:hypothetical protein JST97_12990 [bacterium]|nr:hypothetical protein [bacterium]
MARLLQAGARVPDGFCLLPDCSLESGLQAWRARFPNQPLAVRSSSNREDGAVQSFAGQFTTILNVTDEAGFLQAVERVRSSIHDGSVLVQPMLAARVAGVVFTADPTTHQPAARVEATPGLGEALVSGRVRPSAWRVQQQQVLLLDEPACLSDAEVLCLLSACQQARQILDIGELDLEFAYTEEGEPWLLQARPITAQALTLETLCLEQRQALSARARPEGTVWSRYSVADTLPHPLPMTWAVVDRMLSLRGAYGKLYRDMGYDPDPELGQGGVAELICGRPYLNLSREVRLYFKDFPFDYPIAKLKADPRKALNPIPEVNLSQARPGFWPRLPVTLWKMFKANSRLIQLRKQLEKQLRQQIVPAFLAKMEALRAQPLDQLSLADLRERLEQLFQLIVDDFAADSLKASALAQLLSQGQPPRSVALDPETDLARLMSRAAAGELEIPDLLGQIGHRGPGEMELANPRWAEIPELLSQELAHLRPTPPPSHSQPGPADPWLRLRESARHWLMYGWAEIRRTLLAIDARLGLEGGVFWLTPDELGRPDPDLIARRRRQHRLLQSLPCPPVIFSDDLEAIGRAPDLSGGPELSGTGLSWGMAEGAALVVQRADQVPPAARDYVLVCPSTDPAYTSAMSRARALVVETGGVLSHGAIVARELGLPAVSNVNIARIRAGQRLHVDGAKGLVCLLD